MLSFRCLLTCIVSNEKSVIILIVDTSFFKKISFQSLTYLDNFYQPVFKSTNVFF